jgi:hypothetical protein
MRKQFSLVLAAMLASGGLMWNSISAQQAHAEYSVEATTQPTTAPTTKPLAADSGDAKNIRMALGKTVDNALLPHGSSNLANTFIEPDSKRIISQVVNYNDVDDQVRHFRTNWHKKYHTDFTVGPHDKIVFNDQAAPAYPGWIPVLEPQMASAEMTAGNETATPATHPYYYDEKTKNPAIKKTASGLDAATVILSPWMGLPEFPVHLMPEGNIATIWRMDIPDHIDNQRLHDNLLHALQALNSSVDQWPENKDDAYRFVSQRTLAAVNDVPLQGMAQPAGYYQSTDQYQH